MNFMLSTFRYLHPNYSSSSFPRNMRIACLQFNPELGKLPANVARADALLQAASPQDIDLLVLPELAFTGKSSSPRTPSFFPNHLLAH